MNRLYKIVLLTCFVLTFSQLKAQNCLYYLIQPVATFQNELRLVDSFEIPTLLNTIPHVGPMGYDAANDEIIILEDSPGPNIIRIEPANGTVVSITPVTGLPINTFSFVGAMDFNGNFIMLSQARDLFSIDLSNHTATNLNITGYPGMASDFVIDPLTGLLYGFDNGLKNLFTLDLSTGVFTTYSVSGLPAFEIVRMLYFDSQNILNIVTDNGNVYDVTFSGLSAVLSNFSMVPFVSFESADCGPIPATAPAEFRWTNNGSSDLWSDPANWSTISGFDADNLPDENDRIVFDGTTPGNSKIDSLFTIKDLIIQSSFTGLISLSANVLSDSIANLTIKNGSIIINNPSQFNANGRRLDMIDSVIFNANANFFDIGMKGSYVQLQRSMIIENDLVIRGGVPSNILGIDLVVMKGSLRMADNSSINMSAPILLDGAFGGVLGYVLDTPNTASVSAQFSAITLNKFFDDSTVRVDLNIDVVGGISVQGGSMELNAVTVNTPIFVLSDSIKSPRLSGAGTINGNVTVGPGGRLSPGFSPGIITINGNLVLDANSILDIEVNGPNPGTDHDQLIVNGSVQINGASLVGVATSIPVPDIVIIDNDGADAISGSGFVNVPNNNDQLVLSGGMFEVLYNGNTGNDFVLTNGVPASAIPTTSGMVKLLLGLLIISLGLYFVMSKIE